MSGSGHKDGDPADDFIDPEPPGEMREFTSTSWDRGSNRDGGGFLASTPTDAIAGLGCLEGAEVTGIEVEIHWDTDRRGRNANVFVWGPEHDYYEAIAQGWSDDLDVTIDSKTVGSAVVRDIHWERIVTDAFLVEDCPERAELTASWELDRSTRYLRGDRCEITLW